MRHPGRGKKAKIATRELPEEEPEFQIAPMIDILLVLLVFFMSISSTQVLQVNEAVKLPVARDANPDKENTTQDGRVIVNILWNSLNSVGTIEIGGQNYGVAADIQPLLAAAIQKTPDAQVLLRADRQVRYDYLRSVLKAAGAAGVSNVTFSVVNREN
jgi:biopolymer transport protein ExbD